MAILFLLLAVLVGVVIGDAVLENSTASTVTLFDRSFDQLSDGELLAVFAGLGFLLALFLFLAFGASRSRRTRRRELRSARRDAESRPHPSSARRSAADLGLSRSQPRRDHCRVPGVAG